MGLVDFFYLYPTNGSSQGAQRSLPTPYIVLFVPCCMHSKLFLFFVRNFMKMDRILNLELSKKEKLLIFSMTNCTRHGRNLSLYLELEKGCHHLQLSDTLVCTIESFLSILTRYQLMILVVGSICLLIPRGNIQMIIHRMTIRISYFHSNRRQIGRANV